MDKNFDSWNILKKKVNNRTQVILFNEREIWWCSLGLNVGSEQDGLNEYFERPVLILKKFNLNLAWILPLTRKVKISKYYFELDDKESSIILSQIKLISNRRLLRKIRSLSKKEFRIIVNKVGQMISEIEI